MTTSPAPATTSAPIADPSKPIDFDQARQAAAEAENAETPEAAHPAEHRVTIGDASWPLVTTLSTAAMLKLERAQTGSPSAIVEAIPLLVPEADRTELREFLLDESDDAPDFKVVVDAFGAAMEVITSRPTDR